MELVHQLLCTLKFVNFDIHRPLIVHANIYIVPQLSCLFEVDYINAVLDWPFHNMPRFPTVPIFVDWVIRTPFAPI